MMSTASEVEEPSATRDPTYYIPDGNTVLLVENTLFKVHRSMLVKDKSAFDSMFSLEAYTEDTTSSSSLIPSTANAEGESDENPIRLQGDKAEEFSALLWSLYSLPSEIASAMSAHANDLQLINLARIAHKYQFRSTENWALNSLTAYHSSTVGSPSVQNLVQITELSILCDCKALLNAAVAKWKRLLGEGRAVAVAINVAERLNLRSLLGISYYQMMLKGREAWDSDPQLNARQRIRLLSGHYNLIKLCEELPSCPPRLVHDHSCIRKGKCKNAFAAFWKMTLTSKEGGLVGQVLKVQSADLLAKVMLAESIIRAYVEGNIPNLDLSESGEMHDKCLQIALRAAEDKVKEVQDNLVDLFSDVV
ncbi:BTB domain-containing protein [Favolaschia claudopus]|uniref:BTB domain-containing protein n=1 Tax=Favolaschia claudopus TaxID=2862362 RepID=A0AAW0DBV7_9AGAR